MKFQHYSTKYGYIDEDDEQIGKGFMDKIKPLFKVVGKHLLKGAATLAGNKLGEVIANKLVSSKVNNTVLQPDTALAIAQNARRKVFEDLNIIPKKQEASMPSVELAAKIANPGLVNQPMALPPAKVNPMMIGTGMSKSKKKKVLSKMKFF